jgi:hypothetical protein
MTEAVCVLHDCHTSRKERLLGIQPITEMMSNAEFWVLHHHAVRFHI